MKYLWFWLALPLLATAGCRGSQKAVYAPDKVTPSENALLWKVSGNGLKKSSYVFGTIHLIPKTAFQFSDQAREALKNSKVVAFEIDMKEMTNLRTQFSLLTKAFMAGGKTLRDLLPAEDYTFVREKMKDKGLPLSMLERMKPMFLSTLIATDGDEAGAMQGSGAMTSVEMEIFRMSKRSRLASTGLETADYQLSIFDSIPYADQARLLVESLRTSDTLEAGKTGQLQQMIDLYQSQDITSMQRLIGEEALGIKGYEELLLNRRNRNWIPVMGRLMRTQPTFFAVGAGHLGGSTGVVSLLRQAGYRVEPLL